jgi:hypothetical protein
LGAPQSKDPSCQGYLPIPAHFFFLFIFASKKKHVVSYKLKFVILFILEYKTSIPSPIGQKSGSYE